MADYTADTASKLIGYCNTSAYPRAAAGDTINVSNGTYDLSGTALQPVAGVIIAGASEAGVIIQGIFVCDNNDVVNTTQISDLTIQPKAGEISIQFVDGLFTITDVTMDGVNGQASNLCDMQNATNKCEVTLTRVTALKGKSDNLSASGAAFGSTSWVKLYDCESHTPNFNGASAGIENCLTTHNGVSMYDHNGYYHTQNGGKAVATDSAGTPLVMMGSKVVGRLECTQAYSVNRASSANNDTFIVHDYAYSCRSDASGFTGDGFRTASSGTVFESCTVVGDAIGRPAFYVHAGFNATISNCVAKDLTQDSTGNGGVYCDIGGSAASLTIENCYISNIGKRGIQMRSNNTALTANIYGNIITGISGAGPLDIYFLGQGAPGGTLVQNSGFNCLPGNTSGYTESADEADIDATGELYADLWPIAGGNCDIGKGHMSRRSLGAIDLYGRPKLRAYADVIGPVHPQRPDGRNLLKPLARQGRDLVASNWSS